MGRTLTIVDDEVGVASVRIEHRDGTTRMTELHFSEIGDRGMSVEQALTLMQDLGMSVPVLPQPATIAAPAGPPRARAKAAPARKPRKAPGRQKPGRAERAIAQAPEPEQPPPALPAAAPQPEPQPAPQPQPQPVVEPTPAPVAVAPPAQRRRRRTGAPPTRDQLREAFRRHRGNMHDIADELDASVSTVAGWIRKARENGARINLEGLAAEVVTDA